MSQTKFTPGPWYIHDGILPAKRGNGIVGTYEILNKETHEKDVKVIGIVLPYGGNFPVKEEAHANAKLFAAGPEMLEALMECKKHLFAKGYGPLDTIYARIINAIEKATA